MDSPVDALKALIALLDAGLSWRAVRGPGVMVANRTAPDLWTVVMVVGGEYHAVVEYGAPAEPIGPLDDPGTVAGRIARMLALAATP